MASYDPSKEFVVMIIMGANMCVSGIIDIEDNYFQESPFDPTLSYTKIMIYDQTVTEDLTGETRRRKLAVFTRNCVKAMGVKNTSSAIKAKLDAFVNDGTECHGVVKNDDGVAFAFAFGKGAQAFFDDTVVPLFATEKKVVMVLPRGIDICCSLDVVEYSYEYKGPSEKMVKFENMGAHLSMISFGTICIIISLNNLHFTFNFVCIGIHGRP